MLESLIYVLVPLQMKIDIFGSLIDLFDSFLDLLKGFELLVGLRILELLGHQVLNLLLNLHLLQKFIISILELFVALRRPL